MALFVPSLYQWRQESHLGGAEIILPHCCLFQYNELQFAWHSRSWVKCALLPGYPGNHLGGAAAKYYEQSLETWSSRPRYNFRSPSPLSEYLLGGRWWWGQTRVMFCKVFSSGHVFRY